MPLAVDMWAAGDEDGCRRSVLGLLGEEGVREGVRCWEEPMLTSGPGPEVDEGGGRGPDMVDAGKVERRPSENFSRLVRALTPWIDDGSGRGARVVLGGEGEAAEGERPQID